MAVRFIALILLALLFPSAQSISATLHVPADYATIQEAVDAASAGDEVLVAPGVYDQATTRGIPGYGLFTSVVFLKPDVHLISESGPDGVYIDKGPPRECNSCAIVGLGLTGGLVRIEGFTIRMLEGRCAAVFVRESPPSVVLSLKNLVFDGYSNEDRALRVWSTSTTMENCVVRGFRDYTGGAVTFENTLSTLRTFSITQCLIEDCTGSAIRVTTSSSSPAVVNIQESTFQNLPATYNGAVYLSGKIEGQIADCLFQKNVANNIYGGATGGLDLFSTSVDAAFQIRDNIFFNTISEASFGVGALSCYSLSEAFEITGNTFVKNSTTQGIAGSVKIDTPSSLNVFQNNVIANCTDPNPAVVAEGFLTSDCNVFWNNSGGNFAGFVPGPRDRTIDPQFCDLAQGDRSCPYSSGNWMAQLRNG